jgi:predicted amidohydrolase YtcJ
VDEGLELVTRGPVKVILDDDTLPPLEELAGTVDAAHAEGRAIAMHCVTRAQLVLALVALHDAGAAPGDRLEHAAVVPDELVDQLRAVTVVTQPGFIAERGDAYLSDVDTDDLPFLYRCRSLLNAGVRVAAGTDAPFGAADPWASIKAAVDRRTSSGAVLGPEERLTPADALKLFLGKAEAPSVVKRIEPGALGDLCVLRCPLDAALADPSAEAVRATVIAGAVIHDADQ